MSKTRPELAERLAPYLSASSMNFVCLPCAAEGRGIVTFISKMVTRLDAEAEALRLGWRLKNDEWHCPNCATWQP